MSQLCALPSCSSELGDRPYKLGSNPGKYCSTECVNEAFVLKKAGQPFARDPKETNQENEDVKIPAEDFGSSGVYRLLCDNPKCKRPVLLQWKSASNKIYCSNDCLKTEKPEKENRKVMPDEDDAPIAPAKKSAKKATKKAAKPAKGAKPAKAAKPAKESNGGGRGKFPAEMTITVKKTAHELKGKRAEAVDLLLKSKTVGGFRELLAKKEAAGNDRISTYAGFALNTASELGLVVLK